MKMSNRYSVIFLALISHLLSCEEQSTPYSSTYWIDSISTLNIQIDSLQKTNLDGGGEMDYWQQSGPNHRALKQAGVKDIKLYLLQSLSDRFDLIPVKPILGGHVTYNRISLLGDRWAIASYEDGHIGGLMLLKYDIKNEHPVWQRLDWYSND